MTDPTTILRAVCDLFGVTLAELRGPRRYKRLMPARHAAAWALRQSGMGTEEAGALLHRDHTTIIASTRRAEALARHDLAFAARLRALLAACSAAPAQPPVPPKRMSPPLRLSLTLWGIVRPQAA